jgi:hypothetical protein
MVSVVWRWDVVSFGSELVPVVGSNIPAREVACRPWDSEELLCFVEQTNTKRIPRGILLISAGAALQIVSFGIPNNQRSTSYELTERIAGLSFGNLLTVTYFFTLFSRFGWEICAAGGNVTFGEGRCREFGGLDFWVYYQEWQSRFRRRHLPAIQLLLCLNIVVLYFLIVWRLWNFFVD